MAFINSTDDSFDKDVLQSQLAVIQFSANWCAPCKILKPLMEELSNEMSDKMKFFYHDIDSEPNTPTRYGVRGVPTVMIFKNGELKSQKVGSVPKTVLKTWIQENQ
jgi:thioredoxin 1|tara:strand:- start:1843 stop:2160 length:318 start_codon:yes stop_codon:yes gene_type:complete